MSVINRPGFYQQKANPALYSQNLARCRRSDLAETDTSPQAPDKHHCMLVHRDTCFSENAEIIAIGC